MKPLHALIIAASAQIPADYSPTFAFLRLYNVNRLHACGKHTPSTRGRQLQRLDMQQFGDRLASLNAPSRS